MKPNRILPRSRRRRVVGRMNLGSNQPSRHPSTADANTRGVPPPNRPTPGNLRHRRGRPGQPAGTAPQDLRERTAFVYLGAIHQRARG